MTTAVKYWRVYFRSVNTYNYGQLVFRTLQPRDAAGMPLTTGLTVTASGFLMNATSYPVTNLLDDDVASASYCAINYPDYQSTTQWRYFNFTYLADTQPDHFLVNINEAAINANSVIPANSVDFCVDSSSDGVTWYRQALVYRPCTSANANLRFAASNKSTLWPIPPTSNIEGSGGIYGIVSEDGVAQANRPAVLFERDTFFKVGYTTTDENGGYAFNGLNEAREFMVMSHDPSGPPFKNALVWDRINPINTKGNLTPQSAFWARRTRDSSLGMCVSYADYLNGAVYRFFRANVIGFAENMLQSSDQFWGFDFYPESRVGGSIRFLKSGRHLTPTPNNNGLFVRAGQGTFNGRNAAGASENYANLSWEYIFKAPSVGETALIMMWGGRRDSDDVSLYGYDYYNGYNGLCAGPCLEVNTTVMNVRMGLSGRNLSTVRASAPVTPGEVYHVIVTYEQDSAIKLYVNGALVQTTAISGGGRLWGWCRTQNVTNENWDYLYVSQNPNGAARRFDVLSIGGYGSPPFNTATSHAYAMTPPAHGGGFGLAAMYGRVFSNADVSNFYDSFINWDTHIVPTSQSGYMAEVEADNPVMYFRMNELQSARPINTVGMQDFLGGYEGTPVFNAPGFVSGSTAVTVSSGGLNINNFSALSTTFTVEQFIRPSSVAGTQRIWLLRVYNERAVMYLSMIGGFISLSVTDPSNTTTTIAFAHPLLVAGTAYHVAVTYDPWQEKTSRLYINGLQVSQQPASVFPDTGRTATWLSIGSNASGTAPTFGERFQGQMGEFAAYNYVVPAARLLAHFDARNA